MLAKDVEYIHFLQMFATFRRNLHRSHKVSILSINLSASYAYAMYAIYNHLEKVSVFWKLDRRDMWIGSLSPFELKRS